MAVIFHATDLLLDVIHHFLVTINSRQVFLVFAEPKALSIIDEFMGQVKVIVTMRQQYRFACVWLQDRQFLFSFLSALQSLLELKVLQCIRRFNLFIEGYQCGLF